MVPNFVCFQIPQVCLILIAQNWSRVTDLAFTLLCFYQSSALCFAATTQRVEPVSSNDTPSEEVVSSNGLVIGIVLGACAVLFVVLIAFLGYRVYRRRRHTKKYQSPPITPVRGGTPMQQVTLLPISHPSQHAHHQHHSRLISESDRHRTGTIASHSDMRPPPSYNESFLDNGGPVVAVWKAKDVDGFKPSAAKVFKMVQEVTCQVKERRVTQHPVNWLKSAVPRSWVSVKHRELLLHTLFVLPVQKVEPAPTRQNAMFGECFAEAGTGAGWSLYPDTFYLVVGFSAGTGVVI